MSPTTCRPIHRPAGAFKKGSGRDVLKDFSGADGNLIDLSALGPSLDFIGKDTFSGDKGDIRYDKDDGKTFIWADLDGDKKADFGIRIDNLVTLHESDFVL